jgi:DNA helicase HerA-like ATPase
VPLEESAGEVVAQAIVENRFPAVVDLSLFRKGQMIRFMTTFAETLYRLNREAVHLFVDEADAVAPQAKNYGGDENRMLGAMEDIVRRGRKRGIGCTLITQRPAVLNKNVLTQCEVLLSLRLVHPKDIDAIEEWVNVHADPTARRR